MNKKEKWIVVVCRIWTTSNGVHEFANNWDGKAFLKKENAVKHGFKTCDSDDFNLALISGKKILSFWWMDKKFEKEDCDLKAIEKEIF